ncbi:MAG: hypothetical protein IJR01_00315 [Bacteroidales bacterium]|nr:hypothetical protein [Bacteroidales bacterium]
MNNSNTKNYTLSLTKYIGKLWKLVDVKPFYKPFQEHYYDEMDHDFCKVMSCGAENDVLDILANGEKELCIDLRISKERIALPDYVEFELVAPYNLSAKYHVNNCLGRPQMEAWFNASVKEIVRTYPPFAYIKRI